MVLRKALVGRIRAPSGLVKITGFSFVLRLHTDSNTSHAESELGRLQHPCPVSE